MRKFHLLSLLSLMLLVMLAVVAPAAAHGGREVGEYEVVFGWRVEPALVGQLNGPELFITHQDTEEPFEGAEDTLQLEVSFGGQSRMVVLRAAFEEPGHYIADLIPTRAGDYVFHITGTIGDTPIDEFFDSADGEFSSIEPTADIQFPESQPDVFELQAQIAELQAQIADLQAQIDAMKSE